jgi:hypothetical protein
MTQPLEPTLALFANPLTRYFAATRPASFSASLMSSAIQLTIFVLLSFSLLAR